MKAIKVIFVIAVLITFLYIQNNLIFIDNIKVSSSKIPSSFNGFVIVQLSDLHGKAFGKDNSRLISKIKKAKPDIIVITGDLIDSDFYNEKEINNLLQKLSEISTVYYVTGNQEVNSQYYSSLESVLKTCKVHYLRNTAEVINRKDESIIIAGVEDPRYADMDADTLNRNALSSEIEEALKDYTTPSFKVLLSHRPEQFNLYEYYNIDLTFTGHAHGGQIRLPFIGGLFAPNQGWFPKYTSGKYVKGGSTMIINRGLGNGSFPQRLFNQPEIVVTKLIKS